MLTGLTLGVLVVLLGFPETDAARWLARQIGAVRAAVARVERRHLVFVLLLGVVLLVGSEWLAVAGPADMALVLLWDVSTYLDIVLATATIAAVARGRFGLRMLVGRRRHAPRRRAPRTRAVRAETAANDDDDRRGSIAA